MPKPKFIFWGSPEFAATVLDRLLAAGFVPQALVANPNRPVGRKQIITPPHTKILLQIKGLEKEVKIFQPEKLDDELWGRLSELQPDFFVVAAYAKIIPEKFLGIPKSGPIGVHPSLLPKYRGASPVQSAILNCEKETGVSLYLMDAKMDHGPILARRKVPIGETDYYPALLLRLAVTGGDMAGEALAGFGSLSQERQDEGQATFTRKFSAEDGYIEPEEMREAESEGGETAQKLHCKIRALNPEPGVWTMKDGKRMKILEAILEGNGRLKEKKVQFEGGMPISL